MFQSLEKAYIEVLDGSKAGDRHKVLFNPNEYSVERANAYKATPLPGIGSPLIQFVNGDAATLSLELFLDDWTDPDGPPSETPKVLGGGESRSVKQRIDDIVGLLDLDPDLHAPPRVRFVWGPLRFQAVLEKVGRKITLFRPDGTPARATLSVSFKEYHERGREAPHVRLESADKTNRRLVSGYETIWTIADKEYDNPPQWSVNDFSS
ncbi:MAG: LysM peptidoglycan-binding domain-containing protein [Sandaracinobacter sp.]